MKTKILRFNKLLLVPFIVLAMCLGACTTVPATVTSVAPVTTTVTSVKTLTGVPVTQTITTTSTAIAANTLKATDNAANQTDFVSAVAKVLPSVVIIEDQQTVSGYFGRQMNSSVAGSGWILDTNGDIVTNAHVVYNATNIQVTLANGSVYPATVVKSDITDDLAVIKITAPDLKPAGTGDSSKLAMGQLVGAVGNSLDEGVRFTGGYISLLDGSVSYSIGSTTVSFNDLIETDTVINPGNSGGVLIDSSGNVIGITNAAMVGTTDVSGFGYAIPINSALSVIHNLISGTTMAQQ